MRCWLGSAKGSALERNPKASKQEAARSIVEQASMGSDQEESLLPTSAPAQNENGDHNGEGQSQSGSQPETFRQRVHDMVRSLCQCSPTDRISSVCFAVYVHVHHTALVAFKWSTQLFETGPHPVLQLLQAEGFALSFCPFLLRLSFCAFLCARGRQLPYAMVRRSNVAAGGGRAGHLV